MSRSAGFFTESLGNSKPSVIISQSSDEVKEGSLYPINPIYIYIFIVCFVCCSIKEKKQRKIENAKKYWLNASFIAHRCTTEAKIEY